MHHQPKPKKPLGIADVVAAAVLFWLITWGLYAGLESAVPGLFKPETLVQVRWSGGLFILFWFIVGNYLVRPFIDLAIAREEKTAGAAFAASELKQKSRETLDRIEAELKEVRVAAIRERDALADAAKKETQRIVAAAVSAAEMERREAQVKIAELKAQAEKDVLAEAEKLAGLVVQRALSPAGTVSLIQ
jgi:F0F1-type ATP synthase membrane subunit b/b'